ncbi:MAG: type I restriction-modification enzyme R subunit C-terminal domain-containing protein, partial [Mycobacteriaceae bacterium]
YADLSDEEKKRWEGLDWGEGVEEGEIPDAVNAEAVNKWLFNIDTVDKVLKTLMTHGHHVAGGDRLGKTIIFAKNQRHADFIAERFDANYPGLKGSFARVITHEVNYSQDLIDKFSMPEQEPHIAISVDMLDTGIDVPEVANLVFFKPVRSKSKFWQMIGRGTRLREDLFGPGQDKENFFIFDVCGNFDYFDTHPDAAEAAAPISLSQRLFNKRTDLAFALGKYRVDNDVRAGVIDLLHKTVVGMNQENFIVRTKRRYVEKYGQRQEWESLSEQKVAEIIENLAPLPSEVGDSDEMAKRFDLMVVQAQLSVIYQDDTLPKYQNPIQTIADGLLDQGLSIPQVKAKEELLREIVSDQWWEDVTPVMLEQARTEVRSLVRLLEKSKATIVYTDFTDTLGEILEKDMPTLHSGINLDRFTAKVKDYLGRQPGNIALQKLRTNKKLTVSDVQSLQELLIHSGVGAPEDFERAAENAKGWGRFIRSVVGLDVQAATEAFSEFLEGRTATANQIDFVKLVINHVVKHGAMDPALLFESPFTDSAPQGPDQIFPSGQSQRLVEVLRSINDSAEAASA